MREETANWLKQAEHDIKTAKILLKNQVFDFCAFAAFQSAEKALKAAHVELKRDWPPKTHELMALAKAVGADGLLDDVRYLNPHFVQSRYPDAANGIPADIYTKEVAERCVTIAEKVLTWVHGRI